MEDIEIYNYESRQKIYEDARAKLLECEPFVINNKLCDSLIDVMQEDVIYLYSCFEDVDKELIDDKNSKHKKVGNTPRNRQLVNTINVINERIIKTKELRQELETQMQEILNKNKQLQTMLRKEVELCGCGSEELLSKSEKIFEEMTKILNKLVDSDVISIQFVEYRNNWIKGYERYQKNN